MVSDQYDPPELVSYLHKFPLCIGEKRLPTIALLAPKLTSLTMLLTSALLDTLSDPMQRKSSVVHLTSLLERLHAGAAARSTFLAMRGELMRKRVRALRCVLD